jgi:hypothetical protein
VNNTGFKLMDRIKADAEPVFSVEKPDRLWSIILAGGNGDRISSLTHRWMGRPIAKQYCAFVGNQSMLQHTLLRADNLGQREKQLTVIAKAHRHEAQPQLNDRRPEGVIVQPANRGTFPGIFLPLTHVNARDSNATVVIYPSDHFIYPRKNFVRVMARAIRAAEELPTMLMLVGAPADCLQPEYGWICPGGEVWRSEEYAVRTVKQFLEKPSRANAAGRTCASSPLLQIPAQSTASCAIWEAGARKRRIPSNQGRRPASLQPLRNNSEATPDAGLVQPDACSLEVCLNAGRISAGRRGI